MLLTSTARCPMSKVRRRSKSPTSHPSRIRFSRQCGAPVRQRPVPQVKSRTMWTCAATACRRLFCALPSLMARSFSPREKAGEGFQRRFRGMVLHAFRVGFRGVG